MRSATLSAYIRDNLNRPNDLLESRILAELDNAQKEIMLALTPVQLQGAVMTEADEYVYPVANMLRLSGVNELADIPNVAVQKSGTTANVTGDLSMEILGSTELDSYGIDSYLYLKAIEVSHDAHSYDSISFYDDNDVLVYQWLSGSSATLSHSFPGDGQKLKSLRVVVDRGGSEEDFFFTADVRRKSVNVSLISLSDWRQRKDDMNDDGTIYVAMADGTFYVYPTPDKVYTIGFSYYPSEPVTPLSEDIDLTLPPSYDRALEYYATWRIGKDDKYLSLYNAQLLILSTRTGGVMTTGTAQRESNW